MAFKSQDTTLINDLEQATNLSSCTVQGLAVVSGPKTSQIQTVSCSSGNAIVNLNLGNYFELTNITQSTTVFDYTGSVSALYTMIVKVNKNTSTFTWPGTIDWKNNITPTMSANNIHFIFLYTTNSTNFNASFITYN